MRLKRRDFLGVLATTAGGAACGRGPGTPSVQDQAGATPSEVLEGDALDQAARIRSGEATALELVEATATRIEALDGPINAVTTRFFERAAVESKGSLAKGPFAGVPTLLKDLNDLQGTPKSMGSRLFEGFVSPSSSPNAQAIVDAGFLVLGKTNTPEFGLTATTESAALGDCHNPWNLDYSTGGSSGGAAAAVATRMVPLAQASDGGGSIRVPASCCGVFGLKPSRGRNRAAPSTRAVDISVKHCVSRTVRDTAAFSTVVQRRDAEAPFEALSYVEGPNARRLRIGFYTKNVYGREADSQVLRALEETAALCEALGHTVDPITPDYEGDAFIRHFLNLWTSIPAGVLRQVRERGLDPEAVLEPVTLGMAARFAEAPSGAIEDATRFFEGYGNRVEAQFGAHDLLLSPVLRRPPIRIGEQSGTLPFDEVFDPMIDYVSYTPIFNASGHPAMSVPLGWSAEGLPIGSQFIGRLGGERTLLELAYELESAKPWADRLP